MDVPAGFIDTHVHLDRLPAPPTAVEQAAAARRAGVAGFLVPGVDPRHWSQLLATVRAIDGARAAPGVHPAAAGSWSAQNREALAGLLADPATVAVGEIGLDAGAGMPSASLQETAFCDQLQLALDFGKPVLIHCRRATGRLLELLRQAGIGRVGGILHAFSGSLETARAVRDLGMVVGIGAVVTFPDARRLPELLRTLPADGFVLETDAPDLSPHPHRGRPNRPEWLPLIAAKVAELRGWSLQETARITSDTARRILPAAGW